LTFEAATPAAIAEFENWDALTPRVVSVNFGNNVVVGGVNLGNVAVDLAGYWESVDLGKTDAKTRVYELMLNYVFDVVEQFGVQLRVTNGRTAAWS